MGHPASSARTPIQLRLGPRSHSGQVDAILPFVQVVDLVAPMSPDLVEVGSVDAPALPVASVEELEAPGHPPNLALGLAVDLGENFQCGGSLTGDLSPAKLSSEDLIEVVQENAMEEVISAGQHGSGISHLVAGGISDICSVRVRKHCPCQSSGVDRWKAKPPVFKVYSRRRLTPVQLVQEDLMLQSVVEMDPPLQEFKSAVSKPPDGLLPPPPPRSTKRRKKTMPSNFQPRRSRRVARFPPELGSNSAAHVCRHLGFCDDNENISFKDASNYAKLFDTGLSSEHIAALASLFGWEVPQVGHA
jgi:hypothetical protein